MTDTLSLMKKGISSEEQLVINNKISDMVNADKKEAVIVSYLLDYHDFSLEEARMEVKKAKAWMGWYARG